MFPPDEWRGTEIVLGTGRPCLHTCSHFLPLQERKCWSSARKIRCRGAVGEKMGGECWEVRSMESTRMTRLERLTLGVS